MTTHPGKYNIYLYCGATFTRIITWKDESGAPIDLTGFTARLHMRENIDAAAPFLILTTENGGITLGGVAGTIILFASSVSTSAIAATQGVYDLELIADDGTVTRLLQGLVLVVPEVTR